MNRLFVANKPTGLSSNQFLSRLKRKYRVKKAGYSGTLDPFAKGVLIVAFGNSGRLFRFLDKTPKTYRATLWLGASSPTLDIEQAQNIIATEPLNLDTIEQELANLIGEIEYQPPKYSAKHIDGKRAYDLARADIDFELKTIKSTIYDISLVHYSHPFITFDITVSEGSYIRSIGAIVAKNLGTYGILSSLERVSEGIFRYKNEEQIDIKNSLNIPKNRYNSDIKTLLLGQKLDARDFEIVDDGTYWVDLGEMITIIEIKDSVVTYILNRVEIC